MHNNSLLDEFNVHKREFIPTDVKDYAIFPDKAKLDSLRTKIVQNLINNQIPSNVSLEEYINDQIDETLEDYDLDVNPENGTGFEDWIFSVKCKKLLPNYKMESNLPLKPRKEFLNDKYTTWDPKSEKLSISNNLISKEIIKKIRNG